MMTTWPTRVQKSSEELYCEICWVFFFLNGENHIKIHFYIINVKNKQCVKECVHF